MGLVMAWAENPAPAILSLSGEGEWPTLEAQLPSFLVPARGRVYGKIPSTWGLFSVLAGLP